MSDDENVDDENEELSSSNTFNDSKSNLNSFRLQMIPVVTPQP